VPTVIELLIEFFQGVKASRRVPDTRMNPDGRELRRFERQGAEQIAKAFEKLRRATFRGVTADNVRQLSARLQDPTYTQPFTNTLTALLREWARAGANFGREQIESQVLGVVKQEPFGFVGIDWQLANNAAAIWASEYGRTLSGQVLKTTNERIQNEIASFIQGEGTLEDLIKRVRGGYLYSHERARSIAITEVTRAYAEGNIVAWRVSGVTEGKEWNTARDEDVCPICRPLNKNVVGLEEKFESDRVGDLNGPPAHTLCRCWITPVPIGDSR
jgi:SPP1 gp7 family putative phage head morphogenesis protein